MFRRSPKAASSLRHRQEELSRREAELRARVEELERMITDPSRPMHSEPRAGRKGRMQAAPIDRRLRVSIAPDEPYIDGNKNTRPPRVLRKQRREGRWIFLLLLAALAGAVIWLITHLPF